jgi:hypothetical protein
VNSPGRSLLAAGIAALPVVWHLLQLDAHDLVWTRDTASYLTFQPLRQPGYGYFFHALKALGLDEPAIAVGQGVLFTGTLCFLACELSKTRIPLGLMIAFALIWWFPLNTGLASLAVSFVSEALFLPLILLACGLALRARRTGHGRHLVGAAATLSVGLFVREAALGLWPALGLVFVLGLALGERRFRTTSAMALATMLGLTGLIPLGLGRGAWSVQPPAGRQDTVFLPRVVMLRAELDIPEPNRSLWSRINQSFIAQGTPLSASGRSLFEAQLQEAVRYSIGPKLLLGASPPSPPGGHDAADSEAARRSGSALFSSALRQAPADYLISSGGHLWAVLTAGTHIGTPSRLAVFQALQRVDPATWQLAEFRTDYPLLRFDVPLKKHTAWAYLGFRLVAGAGTLAGIAAGMGLLLAAVARRTPLNAGGGAWLLIAGSLWAHSLTVALSVFPDTRYVMVNFVFQWTLLVAGADAFTRSRMRSTSGREQCSQANRAAFPRATAESCPHSASSESSVCRAAATAATSSGSPYRAPAPQTSGMAPAFDVTTGVPKSWASTAGMPNDSQRLIRQKTRDSA